MGSIWKQHNCRVAVIGPCVADSVAAYPAAVVKRPEPATATGACNRLDVKDIVSIDRHDHTATSMLPGGRFTLACSCAACQYLHACIGAVLGHRPENALTAGADAEDIEGGRSHTRGKAPYVFVTWDHIQESVLNLPVEKMDFYVPG